MKLTYKDYTILFVDELTYTLNSSDNLIAYDHVYFDEINAGRIDSTTKHGIRVNCDGKELGSAIICEVGGRTTIHERSAVVSDDLLLICCSDQVYALLIPTLELKWKKRFDPVTCFGIYSFKQDFIIHGELQVTRIDREGHEKWSFAARDIFVAADGMESFKLIDDIIKLKDWEGYEYTLNEDGQEIR